jgi:ATP-dependent exoDNAse (exonuclease V) beta subunit
LRLLWPAVRNDFERAFVAGAASGKADSDIRWVMPVLRRFASTWSLAEPEALPQEVGDSASDERDPAVEYYWAGNDARSVGTVVHRWLKLAADKRIDLRTAQSRGIRATTGRWLAEMGVASEAHARIVERVEAALKGISNDPQGRWLLDGTGFAELPLSGLHRGRIQSVVLDRVCIDADGTHWIIDYKSSSHEGGDLAKFLSDEADRYHPQLQKYAELYRNFTAAPVRCALYFPLLQQFVEVPLTRGSRRS